MGGELTSNLKTLSRLFGNRSIPTGEIAFYNHPRFVTAEQADHTFLEFYGAWVRARPRDAAYNAHVRRIVPQMAEILANEILRDGQLGVCIDASMMLTKMLEEEGVWCYAAKGSLTVSAQSLREPAHFWSFDIEPAAGHVWVVAPPFEIVDVALKGQLWQRGEAALVPKTVVLETSRKITPELHDFMSTSLLERAYRQYGSLPRDYHLRAEPGLGLARPVKFFPSWEVDVGEVTLRYACAGITLSDSPSLHAITSRRWNGKLAGELFDEVIRPALRADE